MKKRVFLVLASLAVVLLLASGCSPGYWSGSNLTWGQDVEVERGKVHQGDLVVMGGSAQIREGGRVTGNLVAMGGETRIEGQVDGDVVVYGGDVRLTGTAVVRGDLVDYGGEIRRDEGAQVLGRSVSAGSGGWAPPSPPSPPVVTGPWTGDWGEPRVNVYGSGRGAWSLLQNLAEAIIAFLAVAALGVLLIAFAPKNLSLVQQTATEMWPISLGVGFLTLLVAILVIIVLLVPAIILFVIGAILTATIIGAIVGIPVILLGAALLFIPAAIVVVATLMGWVAISQYVGDRVMAVIDRPSNPMLSFLVGLVLLSLLGAVPCIGWLFTLGLACIALGAVVLSRAGTVLPPQIAGEPEPEPPPLPRPEPVAELPAEAGEAPADEEPLAEEKPKRRRTRRAKKSAEPESEAPPAEE